MRSSHWELLYQLFSLWRARRRVKKRPFNKRLYHTSKESLAKISLKYISESKIQIHHRLWSTASMAVYLKNGLEFTVRNRLNRLQIESNRIEIKIFMGTSREPPRNIKLIISSEVFDFSLWFQCVRSLIRQRWPLTDEEFMTKWQSPVITIAEGSIYLAWLVS